MRKSWLLDAFVGLLLTVAVAGCYVLPQAFPFIETVELKSYDRRAKLRQAVDVSAETVLVAIDDASIAQMGRWPWPRSRVAALVDKIEAGHPKVVGLDVVYSEPEQNDGLSEIDRLRQQYDDLVRQRKIVDRKKVFDGAFSDARARLDSDSKLLASLKQAGNVVLPMYFVDGVIGAKPEPLPSVLSTSTMRLQLVPGGQQLAALQDKRALFPVLPFAQAVSAIGHVDIYPDIDGVLRRETLVERYGDSYVPSFGLQLALAYLGIKPAEAEVVPGVAVRVGRSAIPLDDDSRMLVTFNGPYGTFRYVSYQDVMGDKVSPDLFKDKIVVVAPTATGISTLSVTPVAHNFPAPEVVANVVENILHNKFVTRPPWAPRLELGLILFVGLFIMLALPRLKAMWGFFVSLLLLAVMFGAGTYLFVNGQWIKVAYPAVLLVLGYVLVISKSFFLTEKGKELVEASAIETNKMLGLSFQGQGMLDMAFEKFRLCPLDDNMKDTLYNLGLDFERKRQFSKAAAVLDHIAKKDPKYKDIKEKTAMLKQAAEGAVFGGVGGAKKEGTVLITGGATKPTLGRYEIEKELGRGAMGIVYLGKDPKINRQVAIKTMILDEGSDAAEGKAVKERFFREAESAGTLNHPNIVRIFDAGEEQDVAYIAMELLDGHDFMRFTTKEGLLAPAKAMEYVAIVADALDYAHAQGIVHRDIKPANLMLIKDGTVRVADFGIARITASSKTATGTVMGTPSYMSPEQVAGKKVDGRSDLFSLGVVLFELLTGQKPFQGGEGIGTLLFQIANDPHPNPISINPAIPACAAAIVDKALAKDPDQRYARGGQLAADLRACMAKPSASVAAPATAEVPASEPTIRTTEVAVPAAAAAGAAGPEPVAAPAPEATIRTIDIPIDGTAQLDIPAPSAPADAEPAASEGTIRLTKPEGQP